VGKEQVMVKDQQLSVLQSLHQDVGEGRLRDNLVMLVLLYDETKSRSQSAEIKVRTLSNSLLGNRTVSQLGTNTTDLHHGAQSVAWQLDW
jgi:hypothetical protein